MLTIFYEESLLTIFVILPVVLGSLTLVARNPIHAIRSRIATFRVTCGLIFRQYFLGFTCSLIVIVYIGAIAILFLFIIMMVPIKERQDLDGGLIRWSLQAILILSSFLFAIFIFSKHSAWKLRSDLSEFWSSILYKIDSQSLLDSHPNKEVYGINTSDLYLSDIELYGSHLYHDSSYPIRITGIVLRFVLIGAIVLCKDDD